MLNLGLLAETRKPVVHCQEKWQAEMLIREFNELIPGRVYLNAMRWWSYYKDETCYYTDISISDGGLECVRFEYCSESWYKNSGYTVLEFDDVVFVTTDLGEIVPSPVSVGQLFEIGV